MDPSPAVVVGGFHYFAIPFTGNSPEPGGRPGFLSDDRWIQVQAINLRSLCVMLAQSDSYYADL